MEKHLIASKDNSKVRDRIREFSKCKDENYKKINIREALHINEYKDPVKVFDEKTKFVKNNLLTVMEVAATLMEVRDKCLFRLKYNSFAEYVSQEFDYSKSRAYQLIRAKELAGKINQELDENILANESQCRELLRLKKYTSSDNQQVDADATFEAQCQLVKRLHKIDNISTNSIAIEVNKIIENDNLSRLESLAFKDCCDNFSKSCSGIKKMFDNIVDKCSLDDEEQFQFKEHAIKELKQILSEFQ